MKNNDDSYTTFENSERTLKLVINIIKTQRKSLSTLSFAVQLLALSQIVISIAVFLF